MSITLDRSKRDNVVSINVSLPDGGETAVLLDFESEYDRREIFRSLRVTPTGSWLIGTLPEDDIPISGNYKVTIHDTVHDLLSLDEMHFPLDTLDQPWDNVRGAGRDQIIKIIRAVVFGEDYPTTNQPTVLNTTIVQPGSNIRQTVEPNALNTAIVQPTAEDQSVTQPEAASLKRLTKS